MNTTSINTTVVASEKENNVINVNNDVMNEQVKFGTEVKKVAFVDGNRAINKNNVKKHVESLKEYGRNLVPMLYVDAADVEGYNLYDAESKQLVKSEDYNDYVVVLDGQHRYMAALQLANSEDNKGFALDNLLWQKVNLDGKSFQKVLIEVNTRTQPWKGSDYIGGCVLNDPENEVALFAKSLTDLGISAKTVNKYIFLNERFAWSDAMKDTSMLKVANINRAKTIWEVVKTFPDKIRKRSLIIDFIMEKGGTNHWEEELERIKTIPDSIKETLSKEKVRNLSQAFSNIMETS